MEHQFNVEVARVAGVLPATIFSCIGHWVHVNGANERNVIDGKAWVYNTVDAWAEIFPYATKKQIERALAKLRDAGLIESAAYNEDKRDRTLWYTLTETGKSLYYGMTVEAAGGCISPTREPSVPHGGNDYINYIGIPDGIQDITFSKFVEEVVQYLNKKSGKRFISSAKKTRSLIHARIHDGYTLDDFKHVIDVKCAQWLGDAEMDRYVRPETLFGSKFEGYVNEHLSTKTDVAAEVASWEWNIERIGH